MRRPRPSSGGFAARGILGALALALAVVVAFTLSAVAVAEMAGAIWIAGAMVACADAGTRRHHRI